MLIYSHGQHNYCSIIYRIFLEPRVEDNILCLHKRKRKDIFNCDTFILEITF